MRGFMRISNESLAIGIPCTFPFVPTSFFYSFIHLERPTFHLIHADNGPIDTLRNDIVERALSLGVSNLIMMDTDMIYHPQTIPRLLSHRLPIVGALCFRRYPPFDSIMLRVNEDQTGYMSVDEWEEDELVEVDATGAGCLMFNMSIFRDMDKRAQAEIDAFNKLRPTPGELSLMSEETRKYILGLESRCVHPNRPGVWFRFIKNPEYSKLVVGEDIGFCQDLKAARCRIFVDTSVPSDHLTTMAVNRQTNRLYYSMKAAEEKRNAAFGVIDRGSGDDVQVISD